MMIQRTLYLYSMSRIFQGWLIVPRLHTGGEYSWIAYDPEGSEPCDSSERYSSPRDAIRAGIDGMIAILQNIYAS